MDPSDFEEIMRMQRMMAESVAREQNTDQKIKVMGIINDLSGPKNKSIQKEAVIIEAQIQGLLENQIDQILDDLESDHFIVKKGGYLKKV